MNTKLELAYLTDILLHDVIENNYNVITYSNLGAALSRKYDITLPPIEITKRLEDISYICFAMDLPLLSALVVRRGTYQPDDLFFNQFKELRRMPVTNKKQIHVSEVKQVMTCNDWKKLVNRLNEGRDTLKTEKKMDATKTIEDSQVSSDLITEETFLTQRNKKIKASIALGPVLRRDHLQVNQNPKKIEVLKTVYEVNTNIIAEVMYRANGMCESCGHLAPFYRKDDYSPYLEITYKVALDKGGEDSLENTMAVCPNCHMKKIYGS